MQQPNRIEMGVLKLFLARFKSKNPKGYAVLQKVSFGLSGLMLAYITVYNFAYTPSFPHWLGVVDNLCVVFGAALTTLGLSAGDHTTDPNLANPELKANILNQAVENGTHQEVSSEDKGNDTN